MAKSKKIPLWLTTVLALVLLALVVVAVVLPPAQQASRELRTAVPNVTFEDFPVAPSQPEPEPVYVEPAQGPPPVKPRQGLALIIDDVGYDLHALRRILALQVPVAIAILPESPHPGPAAEMAHEAGQMVMLHLPMEPDTAKYRDQMDDAFLRVGMQPDEIQRTFRRDLSLVPYVEGVNNHMGSHLTRLPDAMDSLMQAIRDEGLFFIDSRTSGSSVAARAAEAAGLPWAARQIFLDHQTDEAYMQSAWNKALACQAAGRACIMIGHPHPETVAFLERQLGGAQGSGEHRLTLTPLRQLLHPGHALAASAGASVMTISTGAGKEQ